MRQVLARRWHGIQAALLVDTGGLARTVLVTGSGRSGTTWVGDTLAAALHARRMFEPLLHTRERTLLFASGNVRDVTPFRRNYHLHIPAGSATSPRDRELLAILRGRVRHPWVDRGAMGLYKRRVIKSVRANLLVGYVARRWPETRIIHLIRDPREVVDSQIERMRAGYEFSWEPEQDLEQRSLASYIGHRASLLRTCRSTVERQAAKWSVENAVAISSLRGLPNAQVLTYRSLRARSGAGWTAVRRHLPTFPWDAERFAAAVRRTSPTSTRAGRGKGGFRHLDSADLSRITEIAAAFGLASYVHAP